MSAKSSIWTAAITEDGQLHSAFVEGHVDLNSLPDAAEEIVEAFSKFGDEVSEAVSESFDGEPIHKQLSHFWLRPEDDGDGTMYFFAKDGESGAFPVTGVRFL